MPATLQLPDDVFALAEATARARQIPLVDFVSQSVKTTAWLDPLDIHMQLAELGQLKDGWFDDQGTAYRPEDLRALTHNFDLYFPTRLPAPYIFPMPEGKVEAEWRFPHASASIEIELPSLRAEYLASYGQTEDYEEQVIELGSPQGWQALVGLLTALQKQVKAA